MGKLTSDPKKLMWLYIVILLVVVVIVWAVFFKKELAGRLEIQANSGPSLANIVSEFIGSVKNVGQTLDKTDALNSLSSEQLNSLALKAREMAQEKLTADWQVYEADDYSFKYPPEWQLTEPAAGQVAVGVAILAEPLAYFEIKDETEGLNYQSWLENNSLSTPLVYPLGDKFLEVSLKLENQDLKTLYLDNIINLIKTIQTNET